GEANGCRIACEERAVVEQVREVMARVAGRLDGAEHAGASGHLFPVCRDYDPLRRYGRHSAPELVRSLAEDTSCAGHQPGRVGQVPSAALVNVDGRAGTGRERTGGAGVVQVDVGDQDRLEAVQLEAGPGEEPLDLAGGGAGPGFDQREPSV